MLLNMRYKGGGGGESASIFVTGLSQTDSVSMVTPSGKTVTPTWVQEVLSPLVFYDGSRETDKECTDVTGGWSASGYSWNDYFDGTGHGYVSFTKETDSLKSVRAKSQYSMSIIGTVKAINTKWYSKLKVIGSRKGAYESWRANLSSDKYHVYDNMVTTQAMPQTGTRFEFEMPINASEGYISIADSTSAGAVTDNVYKVWLEGTKQGFSFPNLTEYGTYVITASNGTKTKTQNVLIDVAEENVIPMSYE